MIRVSISSLSLTPQQSAHNDPQIPPSDNSSLQNSEISNIEVDANLTVSNAEAGNYQWIKDTIFSSQTPTIFQGIISLVASGYRLGRPKMTTESKVLVGLYKPK